MFLPKKPRLISSSEGSARLNGCEWNVPQNGPLPNAHRTSRTHISCLHGSRVLFGMCNSLNLPDFADVNIPQTSRSLSFAAASARRCRWHTSRFGICKSGINSWVLSYELAKKIETLPWAVVPPAFRDWVTWFPACAWPRLRHVTLRRG